MGTHDDKNGYVHDTVPDEERTVIPFFESDSGHVVPPYQSLATTVLF